jgi:hypothetical protein
MGKPSPSLRDLPPQRYLKDTGMALSFPFRWVLDLPPISCHKPRNLSHTPNSTVFRAPSHVSCSRMSSSNVESSRTLAGSVEASRTEAMERNESETPAKRMSPRRAAGKQSSAAAVIKASTTSDVSGAAVTDVSPAASGAPASQGTSYPETAQKKRKGAPAKLVTPNREDDDDEEVESEAGDESGADDPLTPSKAKEAERDEGTHLDPDQVMGTDNASPTMGSSPPLDSGRLQGVTQGGGAALNNSSSGTASQVEPAAESAESPMRAVAGPSRPKEVTADAAGERPGGEVAERPLKRRKVMLCAGAAAVVAMATLFAPESSFRGTSDLGRDAIVPPPAQPSPMILFGSAAPKAVRKVGIGMPAPLVQDAGSPSRTPTRRLGAGRASAALPWKERQPVWNASFLSGLLSPSDVKAADPKREVTVRPLSSFSPFTAQRDALRSAVVDDEKKKKAVAVVAKRPSDEPKGPGRWKRLADKFRAAAAHAAKGAADVVAGASPMSHLHDQG